MEQLTMNQVLTNAREKMMPHCKVCPTCNGIVCAGQTPGIGAKGSGATFQRNYRWLRDHVKLQMDTLGEAFTPDTSATFYGQKVSLPVFAAPIGMVDKNCCDGLSDYEYDLAIVRGMHDAGTFGFTGGGNAPKYYEEPMQALTELHADGINGIPTFKAWDIPLVLERIPTAEALGIPALAMDIDGVGLGHAKKGDTCRKSAADIRAIADAAKVPFIVKGIMTPKAAVVVKEAGAGGIVVSNHGGRVIDEGLSTAEVLPAIRAAVGDDFPILVDGGIRTGEDIFKMLALGADFCLIGRPFIHAAIGGGAEGVALLAQKLQAELTACMSITMSHDISEITMDKVALV